MKDNGAFTRSNDGIYTIDFDKMKVAVVKLVNDIITIQGDGNYELAKKNIEQNGVIRDGLKKDFG